MRWFSVIGASTIVTMTWAFLSFSFAGNNKPNIFPTSLTLWNINGEAFPNSKISINYGTLPFNRCFKKDCVIDNSDFNINGGLVYIFYLSAKEIKNSFNKIVLDGRCVSACSGLVTLVKDHVCITYDTKLELHAADSEQIPNYYTQDILDWAVAHGGFPRYDSYTFLEMPYEVAKNYWRTCDALDVIDWKKTKPDHNTLIYNRFYTEKLFDLRLILDWRQEFQNGNFSLASIIKNYSNIQVVVK